MSALIHMLVKPRYLLTRDMKYVDVGSNTRAMGYYKFDVEVPGLASTMANFVLRVDTCNDIARMSPKEQEAYYRVVDELVKKQGNLTITASKTNSKTQGKTKTQGKVVRVSSSTKKAKTKASKPGVLMTSIGSRRWRPRSKPKPIKHEGYKLKPADQIKVVQIRNRLNIVNPVLLKSLTVKIDSKPVDLLKIVTEPRYTQVLSDLAGSDSTKVYNGSKVIKVTKPVKTKRESSLLRALTWLSNKYKTTFAAPSAKVKAKVKRDEKLASTGTQWRRSGYKASATKGRKLLELLEVAEKGLSNKEFKRCLLICLAGLEYYYESSKFEALSEITKQFSNFNWKLNTPKYTKKVQEEIAKKFKSSDIKDLAQLSQRDITKIHQYDLLSVIPELQPLADNVVFTSYFFSKRPAAWRTAYNNTNTTYRSSRLKPDKLKEAKELAAKYKKLVAFTGSNRISAKDVLELGKAKPLTAAGLKSAIAVFQEAEKKYSNKMKFVKVARDILATYLQRLDKYVGAKGELAQETFFRFIGAARAKQYKKADTSKMVKNRILAITRYLEQFMKYIVTAAKASSVKKVKNQIKQAAPKEKAKIILDTDTSSSLLSANELLELKPDDIRSLINSNKGYDILWFLYPKSKEFKKLFSKTFNKDQNEMLKRLPSKCIADGIMHMYQTDKVALTKAKFDASVLRDTNVANAIVSVAFNTHTNLMDALPFKGVTVKQLFSSNAAVKANNIDFDKSKLDGIINRVGDAGTLIQTVDRLTLKLVEKFTKPKMQFVKSKETFNTRPYMSFLHSVDVKVKHVYNLTQVKEPDIKLLPYYIPVAFHGTSVMSATLISIFGFSTKWRKVGRALGDGVYFAPNIDKSAQYLSPTGFTRGSVTGVIFLARIYLPSALGEGKAEKRPGGLVRPSKIIQFQGKKAMAITNSFRTQEACVFSSLIPYVVLEKALICTPTNYPGKIPKSLATTTFKVVKREAETTKKSRAKKQ